MTDEGEGESPQPVAYHGPQAVVGWLHNRLPHGIELRLQTAASAQALERQEIDTTRLLLTRNQALLLASFLLKVSDHSPADVPDATRHGWSRWFRRRD